MTGTVYVFAYRPHHYTVIEFHQYSRRLLQHLDVFVVLLQLEEYSDPFDLKTAATEKEALASASDVILPLSEDEYCVPYEMKDRPQGNLRQLACFTYNVGTCESFFLHSNGISNRIGRLIRFRIEFSNRIGRIYPASRNTIYGTAGCTVQAYRVFVTNESDARN